MTAPSMFDLVKELCERPGPIGHEQEYNEWLAERWRPFVAEASVDRLGNFIAKVGGNGPRLNLIGHTDEIGFAVRAIDADGFIRVASNQRDPGSRPFARGPYFLPLGHPMLILSETGPVEGIFATTTGHLLTPQQQEQFRLEWADVWIDIGAGSRAEVEGLGVQIGDRIIWNPPTRRRGSFFYGKAMDNRAALAIFEAFLRETDRDTFGCELWITSTIQEEGGLVGAATVDQIVQADYAIAVDVGLVGDTPAVDSNWVTPRLGGGPIIVHKDLGSYTPTVRRMIEAAAKAVDIPVQRAVYSLYGSDAGEMQRQGVPSALLAFPGRYTHSPFEMVHEADLLASVQLLHAVVASPFWVNAPRRPGQTTAG